MHNTLWLFSSLRLAPLGFDDFADEKSPKLELGHVLISDGIIDSPTFNPRLGARRRHIGDMLTTSNDEWFAAPGKQQTARFRVAIVPATNL